MHDPLEGKATLAMILAKALFELPRASIQLCWLCR
jgi:hypothetical protein